MSKFFKNGNIIKVEKDIAVDIYDDLPPLTYSVNRNDYGFYLEVINDFTLPDKIYGDVNDMSARILRTFDERPNGTGVHLDGAKGGGKTLLVKKLSIQGRAKNIPTIVVNNDFYGELFNDFIQRIETPAMIVFDEFEKIYGRDEQEEILTLFDGVYSGKKLFVLTTNNSHRVSEYINNRPGRMYYKLDYNSLELSVVETVLNDRLINTDHIESIIRYCKIFRFISFDMLIAIIEEMNRYGESLEEVLKYLNIAGETSPYDRYTVSFHIGEHVMTRSNDVTFDVNKFECYISYEDIWHMFQRANPTSEMASIGYGELDRDFELGGQTFNGKSYDEVRFNIDNLTSYDADNDRFVYTALSAGNEITMAVTRNLALKKPTLHDLV